MNKKQQRIELEKQRLRYLKSINGSFNLMLENIRLKSILDKMSNELSDVRLHLLTNHKDRDMLEEVIEGVLQSIRQQL
jgi:hypothetical protein